MRSGALWRLPLAWLAAICVATAGSVFLDLIFTNLTGPHPNLSKLVFNLIVTAPFIYPLVIILGFCAAAVFLTPTFLIAYAARAHRLGYILAGALAGLAYTLANFLHLRAGVRTAPPLANHLAHAFDWMHFMFNTLPSRAELFLWGVSAMIAGALAGWAFARIGPVLRDDASAKSLSAAGRDGYG